MSPNHATPFAQDAESQASRGGWLIALVLDLLAATAVGLAVMHVMHMQGGLLGLDGYYHIKMADLYASGAVQSAGENFHWTRFSIWNGAFSDKDYLWHILLIPLIQYFGNAPEGLIQAAQAGTALTASLIALALARILRANGVRHAYIWTLLLVAASETILFRLGMPRSYLLSILFALIGWQAITRRSRLALIAIGALYTLSYTAPHLLLAMAGLWGVIELIAGRREQDAGEASLTKGDAEDRADQLDDSDSPASADATDARSSLRAFRSAFAPAAFVLIGIAIGTALHPQPLNLVKLWVIQNAGVLLGHWGAEGAALDLAEWAGFAANPQGILLSDPGTELAALDTRSFLLRNLAGFALMLAPWMLRACIPTERKPDRVDAFAWCCVLGFFALSMMSSRFAEYFYPFLILAAARTAAPALSSDTVKAWCADHRLKPWTAAGVPLAVVLALASARPYILHDALTQKMGEQYGESVGKAQADLYAELADAIKEHVPAQDQAGERVGIYTPSWESFTKLFFYAPEYDYVVGLDPIFMLAKSPELYRKYEWIRNGTPKMDGPANDGRFPTKHPEEAIREDFGMHYMIVIPDRRPQLADTMARRIRLTRYGPKPATLLASGEDDRWRLYRLNDPSGQPK